MRYRVELADRPDGLYTVWQGGIFRAQRSTADGTVLLVVLEGDEAPEGFDIEWNSRPAKVVPEAEAGSTFSLQTYCLFDDEIYRIAPDGGGPLTLRWTGQDEVRARQLGLIDLQVTAGPDEIVALWQQRHDFTEAGAARGEPGTGDQNGLARAIGRTLRGIQPEGWERVAARFRQVGDYAELEVRSVVGERAVSLSPPPQLGQLFARLRSAMYSPATGTWFQGTFTLTSDSQFDFHFDPDNEPTWRQPPNEGGAPTLRPYAAELELFPRERKHVPGWLAAKAGLPLDVAFRQANVVDADNPGERPVVNRQPLPPDEIRRVLDYLYRSPVALSRPGRLPDIFTPNAPADVPDAFHTDGVWIWAAAVPHYLRKYGVPPEPELIEHIRANGHRPPYVAERVRATAEAEVLGKPHPPQSAQDVVEHEASTIVDRGGDPPQGLRASEVLAVLQRRLTEYGVAEGAYRIGEAAEDAWSLCRTESSWEVSGPGGGEPAAFAHVEEAARFLLGSVLIYPARATAGAEETDVPDWPILPLRGEPPLNFFRGKRMVLLPAGATVLRFGNETGNLVHDESTRFPETSLPAEREHLGAIYRLRRPLRVLTGVMLPWGPMPGGAVGYLLPRPIAQHLETGALERV